MSLKLLRERSYEIIGLLLLSHWVALLIDRITGRFLYNMPWMSQIGFFLPLR